MLGVLVIMATASAAQKAAPPRDIKLPPIERFTTSTGLQVLAVKRGPLPLASARLIVRAGSTTDPKGKEGLADFAARLLRRGTTKRSADELDEAIEFVGASLSFGASEDMFAGGITAPNEHFDAMLALMGEMLREPSFPAAEIETARNRLLAQLANDLDDPSNVAERALTPAIFGDHPYGHDTSGTKASVKSFTRQDLVAFMKDRVGPRVATLVVVGDIDPQTLKASVERAFAGWTGGPDAPPKVPPFTQLATAGQVLVIDKPEQTQTQVRIAGPGLRRGHPDSTPLSVVNNSLGGNFTSRLMNEVRVNRGLSYGVSSYFAGLGAGGYFAISTFTKTESTREIVDVCLATVRGVQQKGLAPKELATSKTYIGGLFPLRLETNEALAAALADVELYGLGLEWLENYRSRTFGVTPARAKEVAAQYLLKDAPSIVLVGKASAIVPQLKGLGAVKVIKASEVQ